MRVCLARDGVGDAGRAGVLGRAAAGEARDGEVEAAPEEMDGAALAREARAEALEDVLVLTRDEARYRTYFPTVELIVPGSEPA